MARGYRFALQWLLDNDDNDWLADKEEEQSPYEHLSVCASLVADIYEKADEQVKADLRRMRAKGVKK
jgi:hypothetical protein